MCEEEAKGQRLGDAAASQRASERGMEGEEVAKVELVDAGRREGPEEIMRMVLMGMSRAMGLYGWEVPGILC